MSKQPSNRNSTFAVVYTVRDEWNLLKYTIPYYLGQGAARIFIYWDGTSDGALNSVLAFNQVTARHCVNLNEIDNPATWMRRLDLSHNMDHRKRLNAMHAAQLARMEGIEWICCIDPDEIALGRKGESNLRSMLEEIRPDIDQLLLPNLELLPVVSNNDNPFASQSVFLKRRNLTLQAWRCFAFLFKRALSPINLAYFENLFYRISTRGLFPPAVPNPMTGRKIYRGLFLGYTNCKSIMRSTRADRFIFNVHKWQDGSESPKTLTCGSVLHYDLPSADYFLRKFRQRNANMLIKAFDARYQLALIARDCEESEVIKFYDEQICANDPNLLIDRGVAIRVSQVASFFNASNEDFT